MFYDAGAEQKRVDDMIADVQELILKDAGAEQYQFFKTEVPVTSLTPYAKDVKPPNDPELMIWETGMSAEALRHSPTLVALRQGWVYWAHGDGAVENVKSELKIFDSKARATNPQAQKNAKKNAQQSTDEAAAGGGNAGGGGTTAGGNGATEPNP